MRMSAAKSPRCSPSCANCNDVTQQPSPSSTTPGRALEPSAPVRLCADRPNSTPGAIPISISAATAIAGITLELTQRDDALALRPVQADPQPKHSARHESVDQRITAVLDDASQPRP